MMTNPHFKRILIELVVYLSIISNTLSGKYLSNRLDTSARPILFLINDSILKNISTIAIKYTNESNLLKNQMTSITNTTNIIKSIYIFSPTLL